MNNNIALAKNVDLAIKKYNPWLNLYVNNPQKKEILERETDIKYDYEVDFE